MIVVPLLPGSTTVSRFRRFSSNSRQQLLNDNFMTTRSVTLIRITAHFLLQTTFKANKPRQPPYESSVEYSGQSHWVGSGRIILKALDEPYKAYFPHTFGLKSADFLFGLM